MTHIKEEPYSFVANIIKNITIPKNLTYLLPKDEEESNSEVFFYFLIAALIIVVVIVTFILGSGVETKKESYNSLPERGFMHETIHLEEENDIGLSH